jgi:hypothetical protein
MTTMNCNCPKCGGLPTSPREILLGDAEPFRTTDVSTGDNADRGFGMYSSPDLAWGHASEVFSFTGEREEDWTLETYLQAPNRDGTINLTCSECDHAFRHNPSLPPNLLPDLSRKLQRVANRRAL